MTKADYLASKQKNTLGANTDYYDWKMNSAGQDNIGKILLAILSFKRLKEKHGNHYKGGILAIDEIGATLYPASQIKLLKVLRKFAENFNIQIIITTHSLSILKEACAYEVDSTIQGQTKVFYLQKYDKKIKILQGLSFEAITHKLNVTLGSTKPKIKISVFTEDKEAEIFLKSVLKTKLMSSFQCISIPFGCGNLIELCTKKVPGFKFPDSIIVLDGDVRNDSKKLKVANQLTNMLILPGDKSPEQLLASFLHGLSDESPVWASIYEGYEKQHCFEDHRLSDILTKRDVAKAWFRSQQETWGKNCARVINPWIQNNQDEVKTFIKSVKEIQNKIAKELSMDHLI